MGKIILRNNGVETQIINGVEFSALTPQADTYYIGINQSTGDFEKFNPDGQNISLEGGGSLFSLPVPNLKISNTLVILETLNTVNNSVSSGVTLVNSPVIIATDLTNEQISQGVWVEMLTYRKSKKTNSSSKKGMVVPPSWKWDSISMSGTNTFEDQILSICPTCVLPTRGGDTKYFKEYPFIQEDLHITRPNHYKLTGVTESINVGNFLNGRFTYKNVSYRSPNTTSGQMNEQILLPVPVSKNISTSTSYASRFCYRAKLRPTYIKFRYIMFDANLNNGKGGFITGPTTNTIKIMVEKFPFIPKQPFYDNYKYYQTCTTKEADYTKLKCYIENNVP